MPLVIPGRVLGRTRGRAVLLLWSVQLEAGAAPGAGADDDRVLHRSAAVGVKCRVAVRTDDAEVLDPIVVANPVDVIEDERHVPPVPRLALAAELANTVLEPLLVEPCLE